MTNDFIAFMARLPEEAQREVLTELSLALKWRGWDNRHGRNHTHANEHINNIADIFEKNGLELEQYT